MANQAGTAKAQYEPQTSAPERSASQPQNTPSREQLNEEIARRAYELYEESGRTDGDDLLHWLLAEEEICGKRAGGTKYADYAKGPMSSSKEPARDK